MRGLVGCRKRQARPLLSPRFGGAFSWLSCRPPDTETNGSARRFVGGLPRMLEPHRCRFLWCGLRQAASPFLEGSEQKLSPASRRGFFCGRALCNQAPAAPLIERACQALAGVSGTGRTSAVRGQTIDAPQQVAFSPRVPPPGLWVWLYYKDWLPFTFYGALAVLALADIIACCRARIWVWLHRQV